MPGREAAALRGVRGSAESMGRPRVRRVRKALDASRTIRGAGRAGSVRRGRRETLCVWSGVYSSNDEVTKEGT